MSNLVEMVQPNYGIITNIMKAHLDEMFTLENILKEKRQLYTHVRKVKGKVFVNKDDETLMK